MRPALRRTIHRIGVVCLLLSFATLGGSTGVGTPLLARIGSGVNQALDHTFGHLFRRHGKHRALLGEGPTQFTAQGGVDLNVHRQSLLGTQATSGADLNLSISRRTDQSSLTISEPLGFTAGDGTGTQVGEILIGYATSSYGLTYGPVAGPADSQIGVAGFVRGIDVSLPRRKGTLDLLFASGTGDDGVGFHALGLRRTLPVGRTGTLEATLLRAAGEQPGESASIADLTYLRTQGLTTATLEAAYGSGYPIARAADGTSGGPFAFAARVDTGSPAGFSSFYVRTIPAGFVSIGGLDSYDREAGATLSRRFGTAFASADIAAIGSGSGLSASSEFRQTYDLSQPIHNGSVTLIGELSRQQSVGTGTVDGSSLGVTLSETIKGTALSDTLERATTGGAGSDGVQAENAFSISRRLFHGTATVYAATVHGTTFGGFENEDDLFGQYTLNIGKKAQLSLSDGTERVNNSGLQTTTATTLVTLQRTLFHGFGIALTATRVKQTGLGGGIQNSLGVQLTGPLNLGTNYGGRPNPNLPSTITGRVLLADTDSIYGGARSHGAANALVILDGTRSQRTDAQGGYAFRLVTPGEHTISVEPASLGPGTIIDRESRPVSVLGGQIANVDFYAGPFAAVGGRVFTVQPDGTQKPLPGVGIVVDKDQSTVSGPDGRYQVGRLTNGSHTVAISTGTLPASVALNGPAERGVQVVQGQATTLDWSTYRLASISGHVLWAPSAGFAEITGAKDVYVLAEPGEHASITNPDGSFDIADLPPGVYTLSIDPDTIPDDDGILEGPTDPFTIKGGEQVGGINFSLGPKAKDVVFSFDDKKKIPIAFDLTPSRAPAGALIQIKARPETEIPGASLKVESDLGPAFPLRRDPDGKWFRGAFLVPPGLAPGTYTLRLALEGGSSSGATEGSFTVDPKVPLVTVRTIPAAPQAGHTVHVVAKILAPVAAGDVLRFPDGYEVKLPEPRGTLFAFDVRIWSKGLPYAGTITTRGKLTVPFVIGGSTGR